MAIMMMAAGFGSVGYGRGCEEEGGGCVEL
jgi:hypothetical protein